MTSVQGNDATLVVGGCEGNLGRGYTVCRFVNGAPLINEKITILLPYGKDSMAANVRLRYGARLLNIQASSPSVIVKYSELFDGMTFTSVDDGPIQIIVKVLNKDGSFFETIGFVFVIVLNKGYNQNVGDKVNECKVSYDDMGGSQVECD